MTRKMILAAVALVALFASPAAAQYSGATLQVSDSTVDAGDTIDVLCTGLEAGVPFTVTFDGNGVPNGEGTTSDAGEVSGSFTVSPDTATGTYELAVTAGEGRCAADIEVLGASEDATTPGDNGFTPGPGPSTPPSAGTGAGELARTGVSDSIRTVAMAGAALLAVGGMVLLSARRRHAIA